MDNKERHQKNVNILDHCFWKGKWWEKGVPRPNKPLAEFPVFRKPEKKKKK